MSYGTKGLNDYVGEVSAWCERKGWRDDLRSDRPNSAGDLLMLCVTELAEAMEEVRDHHALNEVYLTYKKGDDGSDLPGTEKPEGVPIELADVLIRIFDMAGRWDIDLEQAVRYKMAYNERRPYKHGGRSI
jgi:NTP pyrophosphatase (non-canonical NTP hydrolase)